MSKDEQELFVALGEAKAKFDARGERIAELERINTDLRKQLDAAQEILASTTDLANSWAREYGVPEAATESELHKLIDRLWANQSSIYFKVMAERDKLAAELAEAVWALTDAVGHTELNALPSPVTLARFKAIIDKYNTARQPGEPQGGEG